MTESCLFSHDQCLRCPITVLGMGVLHGYHESAFGAAFLVGLFLLFLGKGTELLIFSSCLGQPHLLLHTFQSSSVTHPA